MEERWACRLCYADNDGTNSNCKECGTPRFVPGTVTLPPADQDQQQEGWQAQPPLAPPQVVEPAQTGQPAWGQQAPQTWEQPWAPAPPQRSPLFGLLRFAWLLIPLGFGAYYWFTEVRRDDTGDITNPGTVGVLELRVGDCFGGTSLTGEVSEVTARPCAEPHEFEIYASVIHPGSGGFPGNDAILDVAEPQCVTEFQAFVGLPLAQSALLYTTLSPTAEGWGAGDHETLCVIYEPGNSAIVGSLRGANR